MIFHSRFHLPVFKCALVKPIGLLCQHAAEEMALNGFRGSSVCLCVSVCVCMYLLNFLLRLCKHAICMHVLMYISYMYMGSLRVNLELCTICPYCNPVHVCTGVCVCMCLGNVCVGGRGVGWGSGRSSP